MNEKFNKNAKVEKLAKKVGRGVRLIVIGPSLNIEYTSAVSENDGISATFYLRLDHCVADYG